MAEERDVTKLDFKAYREAKRQMRHDLEVKRFGVIEEPVQLPQDISDVRTLEPEAYKVHKIRMLHNIKVEGTPK